MPAWGDLINTLQLNGLKVDAAKQVIQARDLELKQNQEMYQLQKQYRDQVLKGFELNPTVANPDTPSINESQQEVTTPEDRVVRDLRAERASAQRDLNLARAFSPKDVGHWVTRLDNIETNLREATKYALDYSEKRNKEIANMLRDMDSPDSAKAALLRINELDPKAAQKIYKSLPTDDNGDVIWNETAKKAIAPYVSQYTTTAEKNAADFHKASLAQRATNAANLNEHRKVMEDIARRNAARKQAGVAQAPAGDAQEAYDKLSDSQKKELDLQSWNYITKNILPYRKGTGGGADANRKVLDNVGRIMAELGTTGLEMAGASADYKANAQSLYFQTKKVDAIEGQLKSFHNNIQTWDEIAKGIPPTIGGEQVAKAANLFKKINFVGVQSIDEVKLRIQKEFNDPAVSAYVTGAMSVAMDFARIMQGPQSVASLTEGARRDAIELINKGANEKARATQIATLESDAKGQVKGIHDQLDDIKRRMGMPVSPITRSINAPSAPNELDSIRKALGKKYDPSKKYMKKDGKIYEWEESK